MLQTLADEVLVVGEDWPIEFDCGIFNKIYQNGFNQCSTDWVMRMDLDYFIHEDDFEKIRFYLKNTLTLLQLSFHNINFLLLIDIRLKQNCAYC